MLWKRVFAVLNFIGLLCSAIAAILLLYAMTLERTNYRLVETSNHQVAICLNEKLVGTGFGGPLVVGTRRVPQVCNPALRPSFNTNTPSL